MRRLFFIAILFCAPVHATTFYVLAGGTGTFAGTSWTNANCKIPTLTAGDVVYIGNSGGNLADTTTPCAGEASHSFTSTQSGTAGNHITIKAATGADHGTSTGWNSTYGVDVTPKITWSNTFTPADGLKTWFWLFCASYYDIDGKVGTADQTGTYGFYMKSAGRMFGFITIASNQCSNATLQGYTIQNLETDGVEANSTENGAHAGGTALYLGNPSTNTATVSNLTVSNFFLHDIQGPIQGAGMLSAFTLHDSWIYTNFSDTTKHSEAIATQAPAGGYALNNLTVYKTVFKNIQGTAIIPCLSNTCDAWAIYNNLIFYSSNWDSICEHGDTTATCGLSESIGDNSGGTLTNALVYGNTFANLHLKPGHAGADEVGFKAQNASTLTAKNNLWWNCFAATISAAYTHDYNTWLNTGFGTTSLSTHDFQIGTAPGGVGVNPFTDSFGTFTLLSETTDAHLNDGATLAPPYNVDFAGVTRGADGTWERGAYEFVTPTGQSATILNGATLLNGTEVK